MKRNEWGCIPPLRKKEIDEKNEGDGRMKMRNAKERREDDRRMQIQRNARQEQ